MSPEALRGSETEIDERTDVYAIGVIIWQIITTQRNPYPQFENSTVLTSGVVIDNVRPKIEEKTFPPSIKILIEKCWSSRREDRPHLPDVLIALEKVWINTLITDPVANKFWKENFFGKQIVSWDSFSVEFYSYLNDDKKLEKKKRNKWERRRRGRGTRF